jgi:hypothetical protein
MPFSVLTLQGDAMWVSSSQMMSQVTAPAFVLRAVPRLALTRFVAVTVAHFVCLAATGR